jgi:membrane protein YdbS with pleckstrin-like domain
MFDTRLPMPRGFSGRPLIALLFAVGIGILTYHVGSWFHLNGLTMVVIVITAVGVVAYLWDLAEKPKYETKS